MTTKSVVADEVLAKFFIKMWELACRLLRAPGFDYERALAIMQVALEGVPDGTRHQLWGTYLLETKWNYDHFHNEFITIGLEECDSSIPFENLLDPKTSKAEKAELLERLHAIYDVHTPTHGGHKMLRLYRVLGTRFHGYEPGWGLDGTLKADAVDIHFILMPILDFDDEGEPIPCIIKKS